MPRVPGCSKKAVSANIRTEKRLGKSQKQSVFLALRGCPRKGKKGK